MRIFFTLLIFTLLPAVVIAQTRTISGTVTSSEDGLGLPGVNVVVEGTTKGTVTDVDGRFSLDLTPEENTLVFSFVGFTSQTVTIDQQTSIAVVLEVDARTLDEVVVIGYGTVRKSDLTGAVSSVRGSDLTRIPSSSPVQALQGKVPGLQITSTSGAPGAGTVVRLRGTGTFNNASPIFIVDGVILENIDFLNAADIESLEVLKDASATAIYGSRGANGVIMVTTRKGQIGQEPTITFSADYSIQQLQKRIDLLNGREFATIVNEITPGSYNNVNAVANTDWQDVIFEAAPIQNYQFSAAGGSEKMQYYVGVGYFKQDGIIPKSNYERMTIKINNTYYLSNTVRLGANLNFTPYRQQNTSGGAPFNVYRAQPVIEPYQADGSYSAVPGVGNVLADIEYTNNVDKALRTVDNVFAEFDLFRDFTFRSSFGVDMEFKKNNSFTPSFFVSPQQQNATSDFVKTNTDRLSWLWENTLNYSKTSGKHRLDAVVGFTTQEASSEFLKVGGENLIRNDEDFWYLNRDNVNAALTENRVELGQNYSMISFLSRVNYAYNNKYLFTATYRRDGSSKFGADNRYGDFPAFALGWNIINEEFFPEVSFLSNLKIRASWGIIGNEKIDYQKQYSGVLNGLGGVFGSNQSLTTGSTFGVTGNPNLRWESTTQTDLGLEIGFFNDQLTAEIGYYNKVTDDILIDLAVPGYLGNGVNAKITYNAAEVLNRGIEYNLVWESEKENFRYRIGTVGTTIYNRALKIYGTGGPGDVLYNETQTTATRPGLPLGAFYGYKVEGVFQNQAELDAYPQTEGAGVGDLRFADINNDDLINADDRTYMGSPIPTFLYGLNMEVGWKGFDLAIDFQGQTGNKIYNAKETSRPDLYNFEQHVINRWTGEGTSAIEPRATAGGYNWLASTRFIEDGSFLRLRSVTLGYNLPAGVSDKMKMRSARFYVRGTNLFTLTKFTGYSPEVSYFHPSRTTNSVLDSGIDYGTYPIATVYSVGLSVTF